MKNPHSPVKSLSLLMNLRRLHEQLPEQSEERLVAVRAWASSKLEDRLFNAVTVLLGASAYMCMPLSFAVAFFLTGSWVVAEINVPLMPLVYAWGVTVILGVLGLLLIYKRHQLEDVVQDTMSLSDWKPEDLCSEALKLVNECPAAAAIRDRLVHDSRPIRLLHYYQMKKALWQHQAQLEQQRVQDARDKSCKALHGLT